MALMGFVGKSFWEQCFNINVDDHRKASIACCSRSSGRWLSPLGTAIYIAVFKIRPACLGRPCEVSRNNSMSDRLARCADVDQPSSKSWRVIKLFTPILFKKRSILEV